MSTSKDFEFKKIEDYNFWNAMNDESPDGTIFNSTKYLEGINNKFHLWGIFHGNEFKAGLVLIVNDKENECIFNEWVIYSGIIYNFNKNISNFKKNNDKFKILEFVIDKISKIYKSFEFNLVYSIKDIRPFLWYNYSKDTKDKFIADIRYTSILEISNLNNDLNKNINNSKLYKV